MLDMMLGHGEDAISSGEVYAYFRPWRRHHVKAPIPTGFEYVEEILESEFHVETVRRRNVDFVIDSSKDGSWVLDSYQWALRAGLNVVLVVIWKHPVEFAYSHWKRGEFEDWYKLFVKYHEFIVRSKLPFISVSYSDLVESPAEVMSSLCKHIGLPYFDGKERFWEEDHHIFFGSAGTRKQVVSGDSKFRVRTEYPAEYAPYKKQVEKRVQSDQRLQQLLRRIDQHNVIHEEVEHSRTVREPDLPVHVALKYWLRRWSWRTRSAIARHLWES